MKLWLDDVRPAPPGWHLCECVNDAICEMMVWTDTITHISLDHDAGDQAVWGGDFIKFLDWLEAEQKWIMPNKHITFSIHSMNPVGRANMKMIIEKNGWKFEP